MNYATRIEFAKRVCRRWELPSAAEGLLRVILTQAQWAALTNDLTGASGRDSPLRFVRFIIQNPLIEGVHINGIISWLGLLHPELKRIRGELAERLDLGFRIALWNEITRKVRVGLERCHRLMSTAKVLHKNQPVVKTRQAVWAYVGMVVAEDVWKRNIWDKLHILEIWIREVSSRLTDDLIPKGTKGISTPTDPFMSQEMFKNAANLPDTGVLVAKWLELSTIPTLPDFDTEKESLAFKIFDLLAGTSNQLDKASNSPRRGVTPKFRSLKEVLRAPIEALLLAVGRVLGVKLPVTALLQKSVPLRARKSLEITRQSQTIEMILHHMSPHMRVQVDSLVELPVEEVSLTCWSPEPCALPVCRV